MSETSLSLMSKASQMLAEANTVQKAKELKDLALTAADWARRKGMGEEAIKHCRSYALLAERRMGEMLKATERATGGWGIGNLAVTAGDRKIPTLPELGISKRESVDSQTLASLPDTEFERVLSGNKTISQVKREMMRAEVKRKVAELPSNKYRVIYADPPWKYGDTRINLEGYGPAERHYPTMTISELCALDVLSIVEDNAVLFLWVTSPMLAECWPVITAWGFSYRASWIWDKIAHNFGHYNSVRHEFLLVCVRGSCLPDIKELPDSVVSIERSRTHSEKPEAFRAIIDRLYPHGRRIELFGRAKADGWDMWGA